MGKNPFVFLGSFFKKMGKGIFNAVKKFLASDEVKGLLKSAQGAIVSSVVAELENARELTSEEKRAEALKRIQAKFKEEGLEFSESLSRLLLEIVVARLKAIV